MKLIQPNQIIDSIFSIIDNANEHINFVSTAFDFYKWDSFLKRIEHAKKRAVKIKFFTQEPSLKDSQQSLKEAEAIGFKPKLVKGLQTNLYFNEQTALITSVSLVNPTTADQVHTAMVIENKEEYDRVMDFFNQFIQPDFDVSTVDVDDFLEELDSNLQNLFTKNIRLQFDGTNLHINAKGRYKVSIVPEKSNCLKMSCNLNNEEYLFFKMNLHKLKKMKLAIELEKDEERYHSLIWGSAYQLNSTSLNHILKTEAVMIQQYITDFVIATQDLKLLMQKQ